MEIGSNIKEYRLKKGLTQKDLAEQLCVTYQAVSRWEKDEVQPSIDSLIKMTQIFNCTFDELIGVKSSVKDEPVQKTEAERPIEEVVAEIIKEKQKPVLAVCEYCNKPIYNAKEIHRYESNFFSIPYVPEGFRDKKVLCNTCDSIRTKEIEAHALKEKKANEEKIKEKARSKRKISFIIPGIIAAIFFIVFVSQIIQGNKIVAVGCLLASVFVFTFSSCLFLNNNAVSKMWLGAGEFFLDGIMDSFSLLTILIIPFALIAMIAVTAFSVALSVFVYPFALAKNIKIKKTKK